MSDHDLRVSERVVGARTSARTYVALFRVASTRGLTGKCALQNAADAALKLHLLR